MPRVYANGVATICTERMDGLENFWIASVQLSGSSYWQNLTLSGGDPRPQFKYAFDLFDTALVKTRRDEIEARCIEAAQ